MKDLIKELHKLEGNIYRDDDGDLVMFCQVSREEFRLIDLSSGNRVDDKLILPIGYQFVGRIEDFNIGENK